MGTHDEQEKRRRQRTARKIQKELDIKYTQALRIVIENEQNSEKVEG